MLHFLSDSYIFTSQTEPNPTFIRLTEGIMTEESVQQWIWQQHDNQRRIVKMAHR